MICNYPMLSSLKCRLRSFHLQSILHIEAGYAAGTHIFTVPYGYQFGESIISDMQYDQICVEVETYLRTNSNSNSLPYYDIITKSLAEDASGFSIRKYPEEIVSTALHLLYQHNYRKPMTFDAFLSRFGYSLL